MQREITRSPMAEPTFQGRRITKVMWKGEYVQAVEGLYAYRRKQAKRVDLAAAERTLEARVLGAGDVDVLGIGLLTLEQSLSVERASASTKRLAPDMEWLEPVLLDHTSVRPNDPFFAEQWGLREIQAEAGWDAWRGDPEKVIVAVLDSGIAIQGGQLSHGDLNDTSRFRLGRDVVNADDDPGDDDGHGTHVTGIVAAIPDNGQGVAGACWLGGVLVVKVFDGQGNGSSTTFKDGVIFAVDYARRHGLKLVLNYSGGGPDTDTKRAAVEYAGTNGALLVAAAGNNSGGSIDFPGAYAAKYAHVIAVGAVNDQRQRPGFASRGPEMSVVAPGEEILSTMPNYYVKANSEGYPTKYARMSGTSQATPFVSALAGLVWSKWPNHSAPDVRKRILETADPISGAAEDYGNGIINMKRALT